ncbi:hypothetical protein EV191_1011481 [Tamaricihabitans halophyticus]|uniref:AGAO-like N2 domain-containing protein n=1 Tax=Tamaricihabitans halophyticus TaxID=1262583 RepID=A0A4R2R651_9PSEU|nr:hypothetical protein [Tamaricihabitans halophyticus]TCP57524.1 hypothetical protein EV191_1011481 [Tamaricihabitans halophyticus]
MPGLPDSLTSRPTAGELDQARILLREHGWLGEQTRISYLGLPEPSSQPVYGPASRTVQAILLDTRTGMARDIHVCLADRTVVSVREIDMLTEGPPAI